MKKVLIISYYWPPSGGAGVQRWIRFCKSLRRHGWEPIVYTVKDPKYTVLDEKLVEQVANVRVLKKSIFEPYSLFLNLTRLGKGETQKLYSTSSKKRSFGSKIGWFIRGNLFIPDARCLWIKPSVRYLSKVLKKEKFDAIVSTGPPHSLHIIGATLKKKCHIPWIADFRDPWTSMGYYHDMPLTSIAHYIHSKLEKKCVLEPEGLIVVSSGVQKEFKDKYGREAVVIRNGYDDLVSIKNVEPDKKFTITHIGSFFAGRNQNMLWRILSKQAADSAKFAERLEIKLIGNTHSNVIEAIKKNGLTDNLNHMGYIPFHKTQDHLLGAQLLLLTVSNIANPNRLIPGKLFEYLKARRPILLIGPPDGDSAAVINHCKAGQVVNFEDEETLERVIKGYFEKYLRGENNIASEHVEEFSGTFLTKKLAKVLDSVI